MGTIPKAGDMAPEFELPDSTGQVRTLEDLLKDDNLHLVFFRGMW